MIMAGIHLKIKEALNHGIYNLKLRRRDDNAHIILIWFLRQNA